MRSGTRTEDLCRRGLAQKRSTEQAGEPRPAEDLAHPPEEVPPGSKHLPFFAQRKRQRKIIDRLTFAAVVRAQARRPWCVIVPAHAGFHLFKTSSRFMAALATSIQLASSPGGKSVSRLLSPTDKSFSAEAVSCAYTFSNFANAFSRAAFS